MFTTSCSLVGPLVVVSGPKLILVATCVAKARSVARIVEMFSGLHIVESERVLGRVCVL